MATPTMATPSFVLFTRSPSALQFDAMQQNPQPGCRYLTLISGDPRP